MGSNSTEIEFLRRKIIRKRPSATTPVSSATRPIWAMRAMMRVPLKLRASANRSSPTAVKKPLRAVFSKVKRLDAKLPLNSATEVTVTIMAQA